MLSLQTIGCFLFPRGFSGVQTLHHLQTTKPVDGDMHLLTLLQANKLKEQQSVLFLPQLEMYYYIQFIVICIITNFYKILFNATLNFAIY